jgi:hypothetical protein
VRRPRIEEEEVMTDQFRPFKPGDHVYIYPAELDGKPAWAVQQAPKKVEPEWVVGQQVSGDDYERLPVGSVVEYGNVFVRTKVAPNHWTRNDGHDAPAANLDMSFLADATLTHLPDATQPTSVRVSGGAETDSADVEPLSEPSVDNSEHLTEPEPLKEGDWEPVIQPLEVDDWALAWVQILPSGQALANGWDYRVAIGGTQATSFIRADAIVRPDAGQVPPWVNVATANVAAIARVLMDEGGMEHAAAFAHAESLDRAGIRAEGGAS